MRIAFRDIKEQLDDPFFEVRTVGRDAVKERIRPMNHYDEASANCYFIDWVVEDSLKTIQYSFYDTAIGRVLLANTPKGLCFLGFACNGDEGVKADFVRRFPGQPIVEEISDIQLSAVECCNGKHEPAIPLHVKGTAFQIGIWKQLVRIPEGKLSTYGALSETPGAAQAVGSAVGANPVSYIVPCHRIVRSDGSFKGYYWGTELKKQLLAYELQP